MSGKPSWWEAEPAGFLSQGDIIADQASAIAAVPPTFLKTKTVRGGELVWATSPKPVEIEGRVHLLGTGSVRAALVLSHSCELDKSDGNPKRRRVLLAPIFSIESAGDLDSQMQILSQARKALLPLPEIPSLGTYYADFRSIFTAPRDSVDASMRIASMTQEAEHRLHVQLVAFFIRRVLPSPPLAEQPGD